MALEMVYGKMSPALDTTVIHIGRHNVQYDDESRIVIIDRKLIQFTKTEYSIVKKLLEGQPVSDQEMARYLFDCQLDPWVKDTFVRHIENIREKLRRKRAGVQIQRVTQYGYILVPAA